MGGGGGSIANFMQCFHKIIVSCLLSHKIIVYSANYFNKPWGGWGGG